MTGKDKWIIFCLDGDLVKCKKGNMEKLALPNHPSKDKTKLAFSTVYPE